MLTDGQRFGRLTVIEDRGWRDVFLKCDCGKTRIATRQNLVVGHTKSCGCLKSQRLREKHAARWHQDLPEVGERFGRLVVVRHERPYTICKCDCGATVETLKYTLRAGNKKSCGCLARDQAQELGARTVHGGWGTLLWKRWEGMRRRCEDPSSVGFHNYGGRGIKVCPQWRGSEGFPRFREDVGEPPSPKHQLDRIDPDGGYEPANVRWVTKKEQARNRRNTVHITAHGKTQCLAAWAEESGWSTSTIRHRLQKGVGPEEAVRPKETGR